MNVEKLESIPPQQLKIFFETHWGSPVIVVSTGTYDCTTLSGFAVLDEHSAIIGLVTYALKRDECEIISLDSLQEGKGIGTSLIRKVESLAYTQQCKRLKLITTNDNLHPLGFYQKRGFRLAGVYVGAVEKARKIKPKIPLKGFGGIPIRDEIVLVKDLV
ncbi:GNAT family N-acetyltransferase [Bacillus sp. KH172YL63]|uniref:GNAT family N-acetyltransferase n=1 Tax=Bacillus sp. KH172YL63 TaxID=2709784 RepID=UPI0013E4F992|nr:GNAT family N-acetyltransferase [Bacillus sp. KH172YL63]BCB03686.1 hypothetical protein KH172YL63_18190 [Bacillus sp. KH172YL63]